MPVLIGIHPVGVGRERRVQHLSQKMGGIGRLRHDNTGIDTDGAVGTGYGIPKSVEKDDVFGSNLNLSPFIDLFCQELAGFQHALRR
ncbi:MAG: hypothetical protein A4E66_01244 [Syntrophus sp. PtaB.Bin001]|nr:MAG: hypothetical protein A4E66_01244 [Syntrophus sp. PtaB.Bin001]